MKYATDHAFRTALEARIKQGQSDSAGVSRRRKRVVFERLLARLVAQAPGEWVLKGGFALELRLGNIARSTNDADFEWHLDEEDAVELLLDAAALDIGDRFTFALERADEETDLPGGGQRWRVAATLAGRIFERTVIDVAFAAAPVQAPDQITTSGLLEFAGIGAVEVPTLAIEQHLAEKLHAYTRTYAGGRPSTRVKDLVDVVVIANTSVIGAAKLTEAITVIFERRAEHAVPAALPEPPAEWATPWRRLARDVPAPDELGEGYPVAAALFDAILVGTVAMGTWQPGEGWVT
jgi:predicted nucleotidyltransferase component of viral defense system